ncbi:MAG: hypothetical protein ABJM86_10760 [Hyphomicrobiales bacterium]
MTNQNTLHIPVLSKYDFGFFRTPGPGLGNLLFPMSRALIGAHLSGGTFVCPTIRQFKLGPYLRNEPDKRTYGDVFKARSQTELSQWAYSKFKSGIDEDVVSQSTKRPSAIRYSGLKNYFHDLKGHNEIISDWINQKANFTGATNEDYDIAVHIRLGDFAPYIEGSSASNMRLPFSWYRDAMNAALEELGFNSAKILIFTDAREGEVSNLRNEWNANIDTSSNAITSILRLSRAKVIISSRSTFSMWGAYLGKSKCIWDKDFDVKASYPTSRDRDIFL